MKGEAIVIHPRRCVLAVFLTMAASSQSSSLPAQDALTSKPNIVFILADDLGIGDVRCYGQERCQISTPNIDRLARDGLKFSNAYVNASVCIPTRIAIMTGRYPWRFGSAFPGGRWGLLGPRFDPDTFTLGDLLRDAGYRTGYVGKWHLGTVMTTSDGETQNEANVDYSRPIKIGPMQYGFDQCFILPGSLDMYPYAFVRQNEWVGDVSAQKGWSAFNRIGPAERDFEDHEVLETLYREAESFIADSSDRQPFFLYLALTAPHTPTSPGIAFQGSSEIGIYGDFVQEVDHGVERVVEALKQSGLYENTLIIFSSDHGAAPYAGANPVAIPGQMRELEELGHFANGVHRGYKFSVYEGGLHVPLIAHWPEAILAGSESGALVGLNDLMATFADLAAHPLADDQGVDSISFANVLRDPSSDGERSILVMQGAGPFVVREGDWKLCLCPGSGAAGRYGNEPASADAWRSALAANGGSIRREDLNRFPFVQLFNLAEDPHEDTNLAEEHPEVVQRLIGELQQQIGNGRSTPGRRLENDAESIPIHRGYPALIREALR